MKHIKICKPRNPAMKENGENKTAESKTLETKKTTIVTEGLGCIPTGRIIDRD